MDRVLIVFIVCFLLPVVIVLIPALSRIKSESIRSKIILKYIEANNSIDGNSLVESLRKPEKSAREILNLRLLRGSMFSFIGIVVMLVGLVNLFSGEEFGADGVSAPLLLGGISEAIGLAYLVVYFVSRRQVEK